MSRILRCFVNADLRSGHDGLRSLAHEAGVDVKSLGQGEYVVFINTAKDKLKVYAANDVIAYHRHEGKLDLEAIRLIPRAFDGRAMNYDTILKESLVQQLSRKDKTLVSF